MAHRLTVKCSAQDCPVPAVDEKIPSEAVAGSLIEAVLIREHAKHVKPSVHTIDVLIDGKLSWSGLQDDKTLVIATFGCETCPEAWTIPAPKEFVGLLGVIYHTRHEGHPHWLEARIDGKVYKYGPSDIPKPKVRPTKAGI